MIGYIAVIGSAFLVSFVSMPLLRALSFRVGAVVHPDARRVHTRPTAILGGAGIVAGVLVGFGVGWLTGEFKPVFRTIAPPLGVVLATLTMFGVGQLDDLREVSAPAKTAGSVLAGSILAISGVAILFFRVPFVGLVALPPDLVPLITVLWVVGMAQAVNLIDGLDGLAAGVVAIGAGAILMFAEHLDNDGSIISDDNIGALIAACVVGACLGYLPWNFHPAKIFMGDAGALTLGLLMAASTIAIGGNTDAEVGGQTFFFFAPLFLPARHPRRPDPRHGVGAAAPGQGTGGADHGRQGPPAPPAHAAGARPAAGGAHPVDVDGSAVRGGARPRVHEQRRRVHPAGGGGAGPVALHAPGPGLAGARRNGGDHGQGGPAPGGAERRPAVPVTNRPR